MKNLQIHANLKWDTIFNRIKTQYNRSFRRDECDAIYEYSEEHSAYLFFCNCNSDKKGFIDFVTNSDYN